MRVYSRVHLSDSCIKVLKNSGSIPRTLLFWSVPSPPHFLKRIVFLPCSGLACCRSAKTVSPKHLKGISLHDVISLISINNNTVHCYKRCSSTKSFPHIDKNLPNSHRRHHLEKKIKTTCSQEISVLKYVGFYGRLQYIRYNSLDFIENMQIYFEGIIRALHQSLRILKTIFGPHLKAQTSLRTVESFLTISKQSHFREIPYSIP